jgi:hypothetical protein
LVLVTDVPNKVVSPIEIPVSALNQSRAGRINALDRVKVEQRGQLAPFVDSEYCAATVRLTVGLTRTKIPPGCGCAIEVPVGALNQFARESAIGSVETHQSFERLRRRSDRRRGTEPKKRKSLFPSIESPH